jgi:hypothetical protein
VVSGVLRRMFPAPRIRFARLIQVFSQLRKGPDCCGWLLKISHLGATRNR